MQLPSNLAFPTAAGFRVIPVVVCGWFAAAAASQAANDAEGDGTAVLHVAGYFDDDDVFLFFRFPTENPSWYHQYWVFRDGGWTRYGSGTSGPDEHGFYEDRISVMWDDGSVEGFAETGGYATVHPGMRHTRSEAAAEEVRDHPYLGGELGRSDVRKFIRESRDGDAEGPLWANVRSAGELRELRAAGTLLDLWQWRAHRSNPVGFADNGYVLDYRHSSEGRSMYTTNEHPDEGGPRMMFDPEHAGFRALRFEKLVAREYGQDDLYYLEETSAIPYDPDYEWRDGDALPHRMLREPDGSRGAIRAEGRHSDGAWRVRLQRSLESPEPMDSIGFTPGETYHAAFAVHSGGVGASDHLVSVPVEVGFGTDAAIRLDHHPAGVPEEDELEWHELHLFHPGDPTPP